MVGLGRPWIVIVIHGTNVDSSCVLDVDSGRRCRSQRHLFGWFCRSRYILTNHICGRIGIVTVFVENETHSDLVRLVGKILSCRHTSCKRTLRIRDHLPNVPFDHKHDIRFLLSILSVVVDCPPTTDVTGEQGYLPLPLPLALSFPFPFSFPKEREACALACTNCALTSESRSSFHVSARRGIASNQLPRKQ